MGVQTTYSRTQQAAIEGMLADDGEHDIFPMVNAEVSASIPFGRGVKKGTGDLDALLPATEDDDIIGFTVHAHNYSKGHATADLDDNGAMRPGAVMNVLRWGRIYVYARTSGVVAYTSRLHVRTLSGLAGGEYVGAAEDTDDGTDTIPCTQQGQFITSGAVDTLVVLEVDFRNKPDA